MSNTTTIPFKAGDIVVCTTNVLPDSMPKGGVYEITGAYALPTGAQFVTVREIGGSKEGSPVGWPAAYFEHAKLSCTVCGGAKDTSQFMLADGRTLDAPLRCSGCGRTIPAPDAKALGAEAKSPTERPFMAGDIVICIDNGAAEELVMHRRYRVREIDRFGNLRVDPLDMEHPYIKPTWSYKPSRFVLAHRPEPKPAPTAKRCLRCGGALHWGGKALWHDADRAKGVEGSGDGDAVWARARAEDAAQCQKQARPHSTMEEVADGLLGVLDDEDKKDAARYRALLKALECPVETWDDPDHDKFLKQLERVLRGFAELACFDFAAVEPVQLLGAVKGALNSAKKA